MRPKGNYCEMDQDRVLQLYTKTKGQGDMSDFES